MVTPLSKYLHRNKTTIYREIAKITCSEGLYDARFSHEITRKNMIRIRDQGPSLETIDLIRPVAE